MPTAPKAPETGRPSIFRNKDRTKPKRAFLTDEGHRLFEVRRKELGKIAKKESAKVSDGDVVEYLIRGIDATIAYIRKHA